MDTCKKKKKKRKKKKKVIFLRGEGGVGGWLFASHCLLPLCVLFSSSVSLFRFLFPFGKHNGAWEMQYYRRPVFGPCSITEGLRSDIISVTGEVLFSIFYPISITPETILDL